MITRTKARERPSLFSNQQLLQNNDNGEETSSQTSPYSLSNEDMNQLTEEFDQHPNDGGELTTSGRTYEELVNSQQKQQQQNNRDSMMSEETEESEEYTNRKGGHRGPRQSVGFMLGRNSLSNWSTIGGGGEEDEINHNNDIPSTVQLEQMNTGRKSNVSRHSLGRNSLGGQSLNLDTPNVMSHVNVSSRVNSRATSQQRSLAGQARLATSRPSHKQSTSTAGGGGGGGRRSQHSLNMSHISSSSSSGLLNESEDTGGMLGDSWSPIRTSLENSFVKSVANNNDNNTNNNNGGDNTTSLSIGVKRSGSLSPIRGRSSTSSLSPKKGDGGGRTSPTKSKSPLRSPVRSPLGDISPNRSPTRDGGGRGQSPKKKQGASPKRGNGKNSPNRRATTTTLPTQKKALSPNGTYSLKEAEGKRLSLPVTTTGSGGTSSSSNMSVSSGGSHTTSSSKTLLTQSASKTMKMALPSLGSSRKGFQQQQQQKQTGSAVEIALKNAPLPKTIVPPSHSQESEMTMLSPEKTSTKENVRSPAPTPNSQRRVIKRFRASVPTANYLMPEDMLDDSLEKNPSRKLAATDVPTAGKNVHRGDQAARQSSSKAVAKPMEMEKAEATSSLSSYENAFEFPSSESIPLPRTKTLGFFHDQAISAGSPSHQYQLNRAGTNLLSLQEVILPSIAYETNAVLKEKQAKAQRYAQDGRPDSQGKEVIKAIETCRKVVTKCTGEAMKVAGEAWRTREKEREQLRVQRLANQEEQRKLDELKAKKERKEARARSRHERYERQKREKQRNHPRNKEMWQEVAKLMVDIQRLEKEERMWKETLTEVNAMEDNYQPPEVMDLESITDGEKNGDDALVTTVKDATLESTTHTLVEDVTMATERINWMLKSVSLAMEESDKLRKDAYDRYQYDGHKFYGYPKVDDSKGLFMALSMESPLRRD